MSEVHALSNLDIPYIIIGVIILLVAVRFVWGLGEWVCQKAGIEFKYKREKKEDHDVLVELVKELGNFEEESKADDSNLESMINSLTDRVAGIEENLNNVIRLVEEWSKSETENRRNELKELIYSLYQKHNKNKAWTEIDREVFMGLIKDYERYGGTNGFVHSLCLPESYKWEIIQ